MLQIISIFTKKQKQKKTGILNYNDISQYLKIRKKNLLVCLYLFTLFYLKTIKYSKALMVKHKRLLMNWTKSLQNEKVVDQCVLT